MRQSVRWVEHPGSGPGPGEIKLSTDIRRGGAFILFALAVYGAMIVLGCAALGGYRRGLVRNQSKVIRASPMTAASSVHRKDARS